MNVLYIYIYINIHHHVIFRKDAQPRRIFRAIPMPHGLDLRSFTWGRVFSPKIRKKLSEKSHDILGIPSSKLTVRPWQMGVGRWVSTKNWSFSGSMFIYQRVTYYIHSFFLDTLNPILNRLVFFNIFWVLGIIFPWWNDIFPWWIKMVFLFIGNKEGFINSHGL